MSKKTVESTKWYQNRCSISYTVWGPHSYACFSSLFKNYLWSKTLTFIMWTYEHTANHVFTVWHKTLKVLWLHISILTLYFNFFVVIIIKWYSTLVLIWSPFNPFQFHVGSKKKPSKQAINKWIYIFYDFMFYLFRALSVTV